MILGLLAAFGTLASWSAGTFSFLTASRRMNPTLLNRARLFLAVCATFVLACAINLLWPWELFTRPTTYSWLFLGLSGIVGLTIGDHCGFSALRILGARRQSVVSTISPAAAAIAAYFLLSEQLSMQAMIGMGLSTAGVMWALGSAEERTAVDKEGYGSFGVGLLLAVLGALCQGLGLVLAKMGMHPEWYEPSGTFVHEVGGVQATFMRMTIGFLAVYVLDFVMRAPFRPLREAFKDKTGRRAMYLGTLFGPIIGVTLSLVAVREISAAIAQTIFSMVPLVVLATAAIVQRERMRPSAIIGAIVAVTGVVLLVL
ncbi:MAG: DMT family transporter [bacterium]|nr:DMT family transporter [bacterium]